MWESRLQITAETNHEASGSYTHPSKPFSFKPFRLHLTQPGLLHIYSLGFPNVSVLGRFSLQQIF